MYLAPPSHGRGPPYQEQGRPPPPYDQRFLNRNHGPPLPPSSDDPSRQGPMHSPPTPQDLRQPQKLPSQNESPPSHIEFNNNQPSNTNDESNEQLIKNLKLIFSDDFRKSFLQSSQEPTEEPNYKGEPGQPLLSADANINDSINITPPPLPSIFQVVPVTPES